MKKYTASVFLLLFCICYNGRVNGQLSNSNDKFMIRHTVVFKLKHVKGSDGEKEFLTAIKKLSLIPGVQKFELLRQTGKKNNYDYGLSMEFESVKAYEAYSNHPDHNAFVQTYWLKDVSEFLEIDYEPFD
jgi:hypothetical protein